MIRRTDKQDNEYHREYDTNRGRTHVEEEGYTKTEQTPGGGKKTTTYESKTVTTKYGEDGRVLTETGG